MGIIPIPTTRVGDYYVRQRLTSQVQSDQLSLFQIQNQISTGQRLLLPSDDAPAALRGINLQRLLDRKDQIRTNVQSSKFYLSAAETSLGQVSQQLNEVRGAALGVADTVSTEAQRQKVIQEVNLALQSLVNTANSKSQGRYLFAGSRSQDQPYDYNGNYVAYRGNEGVLRSYVDLEQLFETNLSGQDVFGGISAAVQGTADLNPQLTFDTHLGALNGGLGIDRKAAVTVSVTTAGLTNSTVVDLTGAVTIGDVARLLETHAPAGSTITADVTATGLTLHTASGSKISVTEVAQGRTAQELGIYTGPGATLSSDLVGSGLNPTLSKTTPIAHLLGSQAQGTLVSAGSNNDILLKANSNGAALNGITVQYVNDGVAGSETADLSGNTLTVHLAAGVSTAKQVAAAITAEGTFTATLDYHDATSTIESGNNPVSAAMFSSVTSGGSGQVLDTTSGLTLANAGTTINLDISQARTIEDVLNRINGANLGLRAEINTAGTGIDVRSQLSGSNFAIGENGGTTATQLGIRTYTGTTKLTDFNHGVGVPVSESGDDLQITARDGTQLTIDLAGANTVQDVIDRINNQVGNNTGTTAVLARLAATGNGIELVDASTGPLVGPLTVDAVEGSQAAEYLGFVAAGESQTTSTTVDVGGNYVLKSADHHTLETQSVFNTLIRLRTALQNNDTEEIGRAISQLDTDLDRVNFSRSEIGSRLQSLDVIDTRLQDENVQLKAALSQDLDVDLVEAISNLTARQYAYQASLQTAGSLLQMTLLDFI